MIRGSILTAALAALGVLAALAPPAVAQDDGTGDGADERPPPTPPDTDPTEAAEPPERVEAVRGTLDLEDEPIEGVVVTVETPDGEEVARTRTGSDGEWVLELPEPGEYVVRVETDTLPEDIDLRDPERNPLTVTIRPGQERGLIFALGERAVGARSDFDRFLSLATDGLKIGAILALASLGLSLIFGITGLINFAHGELVTFGALMAFFFNAAGGGPGLSLWMATPLAMVAGGLLGWSLEKGLWRSLRERGTGRIQLFVISIGLALFLRHIYLVFFGAGSRPYAGYAVQQPLALGPVSLPPRDWVIMAIALVVLVAVGALLQGTRLGTGMRAVADNPDLAASSGIDVQRIILLTWVAGAALAALGGVFLGLTETVRWNMGFNILLLMFAAVIVGGLGTAYGAMVGGLMVGFVIQLSTFWFSTELKVAFALLALILVLLVRPQGILGRRERVG